MNEMISHLAICMMICVTCYLIATQLIKLFSRHAAADSVEVFARLTETEAWIEGMKGRIDNVATMVTDHSGTLANLVESIRLTDVAVDVTRRDVSTLKAALNLKTFSK